MRYPILVLLFVLTALAGTSSGQPCFRGRPLPDCKSFWITESGAFFHLNSHKGDRWNDRKVYENLYYTWEIGGMVNRNPKTAFGGTLYIGWDGYINDTRLGIKGRWRWWLSPHTGLDLSPGILMSDKISASPIWCLSASLCGDDRIMVIGQMEVVNWKDTHPNNVGYFGRGTDILFYGGLRFGAEMGIIVGIITPIIIAATASSHIGGLD
jgi:hypothetical protein